ncbi:hypothetical protein TW84_10860 [Vibrio neptunius]|nr:hypothetical protein TW84_10860 [Vibrio neptunius]
MDVATVSRSGIEWLLTSASMFADVMLLFQSINLWVELFLIEIYSQLLVFVIDIHYHLISGMEGR